MPEPVILVANGDLRLSANRKCWPAQARVEEAVMAAIGADGFEVRRGHAYDPDPFRDGGDVTIARDVALQVRESSGGLPAVQAMGVPLPSHGVAQVALNLLDYRRTPIPLAFDRVVEAARRHGVGVRRAELVGLAPRAAFAGRSPASVGLADFGPLLELETYL